MKYAAMTLTGLKSPFVVGFLVALGVGAWYLWHPLCYAYIGIVSLNLLNVIWCVGVGSLTRGWPTVRDELKAAFEELRREDEAEEAVAKARLAANKAKLRGEDPPKV